MYKSFMLVIFVMAGIVLAACQHAEVNGQKRGN